MRVERSLYDVRQEWRCTTEAHTICATFPLGENPPLFVHGISSDSNSRQRLSPGADGTRHHSRRADHRGVHRFQCLPWPESRAHVLFFDSGCRHFDGRAAGAARGQHPREQHGADAGVRGRHAIVDHLCASRLADDRPLAGLSLWSDARDLRVGRHSWRAIHHSLAPCHGGGQRFALSGRRGRRGNSSRRQRGRRRVVA
ncbi:hypothetical protein PMO31116_03092 [Pandoraea morbifera]|uniref:Uncharacterized protein n=1 Tax=Pandoraea morbifera TaxID=2508300 RepID=A0A5E4WC94_9BURK|nr:hypothetical protein PMO31116_03092 [Pandoraea morbifera]